VKGDGFILKLSTLHPHIASKTLEGKEIGKKYNQGMYCYKLPPPPLTNEPVHRV
jgi:hypothetical protein